IDRVRLQQSAERLDHSRRVADGVDDAGVAASLDTGLATEIAVGAATVLAHEAILADPRADARPARTLPRVERQAARAALTPRTRTIAARSPSIMWSISLVETVSEGMNRSAAGRGALRRKPASRAAATTSDADRFDPRSSARSNPIPRSGPSPSSPESPV